MALAALCLTVALSLTVQSDCGEVISDLTGPSDELGGSMDDTRARKIKSEEFWKSLLEAAKDLHMEDHMALHADTEKVLHDLPLENDYVREGLKESVERLQRADRAVLAQVLKSRNLAIEHLAAPPGEAAGFSFLTAGQNFLAQSLGRFVGGDVGYKQNLRRDVQQRQEDILPVLKGAAESTTDVLTDCRLSSKRAFDVLKYDIYNKGVPKTPEAAKAVAHRLADAAGETRHRFMLIVMEAVTSITRDVEGQKDQASATVATSTMRAAEVRGAPKTTISTTQEGMMIIDI